jgi:hypothetical protein
MLIACSWWYMHSYWHYPGDKERGDKLGGGGGHVRGEVRKTGRRDFLKYLFADTKRRCPKRGNGMSCFIKCVEFLNQMGDCQHLKKNCFLCSWQQVDFGDSCNSQQKKIMSPVLWSHVDFYSWRWRQCFSRNVCTHSNRCTTCQPEDHCRRLLPP